MLINYRPEIDALRGLAVLLVVLFHAFPTTFHGGFIGVGVFFVISGYLITSIILKDNDFSIMNFYGKRIRRLFPALITVMLSALLIGWLILYPNELINLSLHSLNASAFALNFELIDEQGYFDVENYRKPLMHLWTLSIEEQFYLLWPLIVMLSLYVFKNVRAAYITLCLLTVGSFTANIYMAEAHPESIFFHTVSRAWEIGVGAILAFHQPKLLSSRPYLAILGCFIIFCSALL